MKKDTKTLIRYLQMPKIDSKVICTEIRLLVAIDTYTVYMVSVRISKYSPW